MICCACMHVLRGDAWHLDVGLLNEQVMAAVGLKKPGPALGKITSAVLEWQLARPDGSKDECRAWLQDTYSSAGA